MANCPKCGGIMKFDIPKQRLLCSSCTSDFDPYEIDQVNNAEEGNYGDDFTVFACPACGGELYGTDHDLSGNCSFCGSPVVFETRMRNEKRPDYIIPFKKTKEDCKTAYLEGIKKCSFLPKELSDPDYIEGFRGIYVPYWIYDVEQDGEPFELQGTYSYTRGDYDYKEVYKVEGKVDCQYHEIYHDASSVLDDDISEQIEPFIIHQSAKKEFKEEQIKPFTASYFSGFYAEPADVDQEVYHNYAKGVAEESTRNYVDEKSSVRNFKLGKQLKENHMNSKVKDVKLGVFPVWFLSYRKNNRVAYAAVNGQTGSLISDLPIDLFKFMKTLLLIAAITFVGLNIMTILPRSVAMMSVFISFIVTRYCKDDANILLQRSREIDKNKKRGEAFDSSITFMTFLIVLVLAGVAKIWMFFDDDMSFLASNFVYLIICIIFFVLQLITTGSILIRIPVFLKEKYYGFFFPILCSVASAYGTMVIYTKPARDEYYYYAAVIVIAITLVSFLGLILNYNRVATRPLPQFKIHTGGDDRA